MKNFNKYHKGGCFGQHCNVEDGILTAISNVEDDILTDILTNSKNHNRNKMGREQKYFNNKNGMERYGKTGGDKLHNAKKNIREDTTRIQS